MAEKRLKAIIIGGADVIKLCVVRAVGSYGCDVEVIHLGSPQARGIKPVDYYSKFVTNYYFAKRDGLIKLLLDKCISPDTKPILFTLDDYSTFLIDESRELLSNSFQFAHLLNNQPLIMMMNKHLLKTMASEAGMKVAEGWPIPFEDGEFKLPKGIKYPCFLKGLYSYYNSKSVQHRCNSEKELLQYLETCKINYPYPVYVEEFIPIEKDLGVIGVSDGNNSIVPAQAELLEMGKGATNGVSMLGKVSSFKDNVLLKQIKALLKEIHYVGIFNIDFVESRGQMFFVELNFRFAAYGYGAYFAGCNIPALYIDCMIGNEFNLSQNSIDNPCYYLNEKIAFVNLIEKSIRLKNFKMLKNKADCMMVSNKTDPKPYKMFLVTMGLKYFRKKLHL